MEPFAEAARRYSQRRERLVAQTDSGLILIGSPGVSVDPSLWDKNLRYLTGHSARDAYLLIAPRGVRVDWWETRTGPEVGRGHLVHELLFVTEQPEIARVLEGEGPDWEALRQATGVDRVYGLSRLNEILADALMTEDELWVNLPARPDLGGSVPAHVAWLNTVRDHCPWVRLRNIAPLIHALRRVKDAYEVECLRRAFRIHAGVLEKIMQSLTPGENESLGVALWAFETARIGDPVSGHTLDLNPASIVVASGRNAAIAHYTANNAEIHGGDLVLIDSGLAYEGYSSDITRTFPADGRFTPSQRRLYGIVLEAQEQAIATMRPGSTQMTAHQAVYDCFKRHKLESYGFGVCGHAVGLNIHDAVGMTRMDRDHPFEPGAVVVIEPYLAIPEEGIGIRIEDGVLITPDGHELLAGPPRAIADVEALCKRA
jgi:Xaa-Pro aminopeptidase